MVDRPGALIQLDTKHIPLGKGKTVYKCGAVDYFTRKRVVALAPQLTSAAGRHFLEELVATFAFPVQAIQTDNGPDAARLGEFAIGARHLGLTHYYNRPYYPPGNGRIERSFKQDEDEFYRVEDLPADLRGREQKPQAWNHTYETVRPHQALDYLTPDAFYQRWQQTQRRRRCPIPHDPVLGHDYSFSRRYKRNKGANARLGTRKSCVKSVPQPCAEMRKTRRTGNSQTAENPNRRQSAFGSECWGFESLDRWCLGTNKEAGLFPAPLFVGFCHCSYSSSAHPHWANLRVEGTQHFSNHRSQSGGWVPRLPWHDY